MKNGRFRNGAVAKDGTGFSARAQAGTTPAIVAARQAALRGARDASRVVCDRRLLPHPLSAQCYLRALPSAMLCAVVMHTGAAQASRS